MPPNSGNKVVVITGASSGLGRAGAIEFARRGAIVVLAARRESALQETARLCREVGGTATVVITDVTVEDSVRRLASLAVESHGRIDVWVSHSLAAIHAPSRAHRPLFDSRAQYFLVLLFDASGRWRSWDVRLLGCKERVAEGLWQTFRVNAAGISGKLWQRGADGLGIGQVSRNGCPQRAQERLDVRVTRVRQQP